MKKKVTNPINHKKFELDAQIMFYVLLMAILPVFILVIFQQFERFNNREGSGKIEAKIDDIVIKTDKKVYSMGEDIVLAIENLTDRPIFSEPCEYRNKFEIKSGKKWIAYNNNSVPAEYDRSGFNTSKRITKCNIQIPSEAGTFRVAVKIYYGCVQPEKCATSLDFFSNEFEVKKPI